MKQNQAEAVRWLKQAKHDLEVAGRHFKDGFFADACYSSEQAAQKALKGYLYYRGERYVWEHSIGELVKKASQHNASFKQLIESGKVLDQYYIPTRYPDALAPPAVPYESYTKKEAGEAINIAETILQIVGEKTEK